MEETGELTVHLATESGLLAVVAPAGLQHRARDYSWWTREEDLLDEANAGRIVPIETGEGGGFAVRVTFDPLDERAQRLAAQTAEFWLRVGDDEEVAVVAGEELSFPDTPGAGSFWATPGTYHVAVTRLRWTEEAGGEYADSLPDYVVQLRPLDPDELPPLLAYLPDMSVGRRA